MSKAQRVAELLSNRANANGMRLTKKDFTIVEKQIKEEYKTEPYSDMVPSESNLYRGSNARNSVS